jgi:bis(5'-nucleosyl)-tetraphosphatase (symmetrical)
MNKFSDPHDLEGQRLLSDNDIEWLRKLPTMIDLGDFQGRRWIAVHGGLIPGKTIADQPRDAIIRLRWMSKEFKPIPTDYSKPDLQPPGAFHWTELYDGPFSVVYGHEAFSLSKPYLRECPGGALTYGIDTGCVHGGHLTALVFTPEEMYTVSVKSRKCYKNPLRPIPA